MLTVSSVLTHLPDLEGHEEKLLCEETLCEDNEVSYSQIANCYWGVGRKKIKILLLAYGQLFSAQT